MVEAPGWYVMGLGPQPGIPHSWAPFGPVVLATGGQNLEGSSGGAGHPLPRGDVTRVLAPKAGRPRAVTWIHVAQL